MKNDGKPQYMKLSFTLMRPRMNQDFFFYICDTFYKAIKGKVVYSGHTKVQLMSEVVTPSDEAFVLLTIENNYDRWVNQYKIDHEHNGEDLKNEVWGPYTRNGIGNTGFTRRNSGWSTQGIERYNELCEDINKDREEDAAKGEESVEVIYQKARLKKSPVKSKKKSKKEDDLPARPKVYKYMDYSAALAAIANPKQGQDSSENDSESDSGTESENDSEEEEASMNEAGKTEQEVENVTMV